MIKDPVWDMIVDEKFPAAKVDFKGKPYYFYIKYCAEKFTESPEKYVQKNNQFKVCVDSSYYLG
ncbi:MAG: YHS domain-containing protein [Candidatus Aminicenantes bacterium]|nr:YHS domain-containing protein [Candidatus Aminicenantes bacterium]